MRPLLVVIGHRVVEDGGQVGLVVDDQVVEALSA